MKFLILLGVGLAAATPFVPTEVQMWLISAVAMILVQLIRFVFFKLYKGDKKRFGRKAATVLLFVVAIALAVFFGTYKLPGWPGWPDMAGDPDVVATAMISWLAIFFGWLLSCLDAVKAVVGAAIVIYNLIGQQVMDKIGIGSAQMAKAAERAPAPY